MRRLLVLTTILTLLGGLVVPSITRAQETAPGPAVGEPVTILSADGSPTGTVTVNSLTDPFEDYESGSDPQRGYHFVTAEVTVANTSARPMTVDPAAIRLVDSDGFVASTGYLYFSDETTAPALLEYSDALAPGSEATGLVAWEVFSGATVSRIFYASGFDTRNTLVDLRDSFVVAGNPISVMGSSGSEIAQITVNGVADPFEGFDEFSAPERGSRLVMVDVTIANTGSRLLSTSPSDIVMTDQDGFLLEQAFVTATDPALVDFDYIDLNPGEEQRGVLYYTVFADVPLGQITYGDAFTRDVVIADLAAGVPAPPSPVAAATTAPLESTPECEGLVEWGADLVARIGSASALTNSFQGIEPTELDPVAVRDAADQLAILAQEQRDSSPPPAAEALNTFMAEQFYQVLADATGRIAEALETGNTAAAMLAVADAEAAGLLFEDGGEADQLLQALETACPAEIEALDAL